MIILTNNGKVFTLDGSVLKYNDFPVKGKFLSKNGKFFMKDKKILRV